MVTLSALAGTRPPAQLPPVNQSVDVAPVQLRTVPVTLKDMVPLRVAGPFAVIVHVAYCTPVTSAAATVAHTGLLVDQVTTWLDVAPPVAFTTAEVNVCVLPGCRLPK